jgi:hypothetical protein
MIAYQNALAIALLVIGGALACVGLMLVASSAE